MSAYASKKNKGYFNIPKFSAVILIHPIVNASLVPVKILKLSSTNKLVNQTWRPERMSGLWITYVRHILKYLQSMYAEW